MNPGSFTEKNLEEQITQRTSDLEAATSKAQDASREKSRMLAYVAHDLKTPLSGIFWFIEMLERDETLSEEQREHLGYIAEGAKELRGILTNILDKVSLEEGRLVSVAEDVELRAFTEHIKSLLYFMYTPKNVRIDIDVHPDLRTIRVDPVHLRHILLNLLSNAIKYNREDGSIFLRLHRGNGQSVVIEVEDTGIGIPADKLPKIYGGYYRVDPSQGNAVEGSGLGLAFTKKLVEFLGGSIDVKSELGVGTCFRVMLPVAG